MIWTNNSFFKMMIYDLERPPGNYPPCQKIEVDFIDYQSTHYVNTLIELECYLQSLRSLTNYRKSEFMKFAQLVLIRTQNEQKIDLSDIDQISNFFELKVEDISRITIRNNVQHFECPVCLENKMFPVSPFQCQHLICSPCFHQLRNSRCSQNCPLCRSPRD